MPPPAQQLISSRWARIVSLPPATNTFSGRSVTHARSKLMYVFGRASHFDVSSAVPSKLSSHTRFQPPGAVPDSYVITSRGRIVVFVFSFDAQ
jgi:hypothetical protein